MKDILCKFFGFLKYFLLIAAFGLVFYCIIVTYGRLEKPLSDAVSVFVPFGFVLLMFIINLVVRNKYVSSNLFFNFVSFFVFAITIVICLRAMFDSNMLLYHRYGINFNPTYFADNLSMIESMIYMVGGANFLLLICNFINRNGNKKVNKNRAVNEDNNVVKVNISNDVKSDKAGKTKVNNENKNED